MRRPVGWIPVLAFLAACSGESRRFTLTRVDPPLAEACPRPTDTTTLEIIALGDFPGFVGFSDDVNQAISTDVFPVTTRAFELRTLNDSGTVRTLGRTATLDLTALPDGAAIPVFMAAPRSFCRVGPVTTARVRPIVARAGTGVLVVGGAGASGAEWYDPAVGAFETLADMPFDDLAGGAGVTLADGRVLLVWGDGHQLYDPATRAFGPPTIPQGPGVIVRDGAQVVRLRDGRVLVAGGCEIDPFTVPCTGSDEAQLFDAATGEFTSAASLAVPRALGSAIVDADGSVILIGGYGDDGLPETTWERWDPAGGASLTEDRAGAQAAALPAGGVIAAFAPPAAPPDAAATVAPPWFVDPTSVTARAARAGATMTPLDDGAVLIFGGVDPAAADTVPEAELYLPASADFEAIAVDDAAALGRRHDHGAALLDDGTVLIVGGAGTDAWIYRHDLAAHAWSSLPIQTFVDDAPLVVPADPASASFEPASADHPRRLRLEADPDQPGPLAAWAVLSGPRHESLTLTATLEASVGAGVGILLGVQVAGELLLVRAVPGQPITLVPVIGGVAGAPLCTANGPLPLDAFVREVGAATLSVDVHDGSLTVTLDGGLIANCPDVTIPRGLVGIGVLSSAPGDLSLDALSVSR